MDLILDEFEYGNFIYGDIKKFTNSIGERIDYLCLDSEKFDAIRESTIIIADWAEAKHMYPPTPIFEIKNFDPERRLKIANKLDAEINKKIEQRVKDKFIEEIGKRMGVSKRAAYNMINGTTPIPAELIEIFDGEYDIPPENYLDVHIKITSRSPAVIKRLEAKIINDKNSNHGIKRVITDLDALFERIDDKDKLFRLCDKLTKHLKSIDIENL